MRLPPAPSSTPRGFKRPKCNPETQHKQSKGLQLALQGVRRTEPGVKGTKYRGPLLAAKRKAPATVKPSQDRVYNFCCGSCLLSIVSRHPAPSSTTERVSFAKGSSSVSVSLSSSRSLPLLLCELGNEPFAWITEIGSFPPSHGTLFDSWVLHSLKAARFRKCSIQKPNIPINNLLLLQSPPQSSFVRILKAH